MGCLNGLLAPSTTPLIDYTASDLERIRKEIDMLYKTYHLPTGTSLSPYKTPVKVQ